LTIEENAITVKNVSKFFKLKQKKSFFYRRLNDFAQRIERRDTIKSLDNISFTIPKGEVLGIIGLNGSGKTTLLRTIAGIYKPDTGYVRVNGMMAPLLQIGTGFHNELNAEENIVMYGILLGLTKQQITAKIGQILKFAELENFSGMKLKHYSSGMRARLGFGTALQVNPDILLVDEVLSVGDIVFRKKSSEAFRSFKHKGKTILYTTHNLGIVSALSDRILLIDKGRLITIGNPDEVIQKYKDIIKNKKTNSKQ